MKNNQVLLPTALAAAAAILLAPLSVTLTVSVVTIAGILAIFAGDYGRDLKPLAVPAETCRRAVLPLAA